jgi:hypothetical protein
MLLLISYIEFSEKTQSYRFNSVGLIDLKHICYGSKIWDCETLPNDDLFKCELIIPWLSTTSNPWLL